MKELKAILFVITQQCFEKYLSQIFCRSCHLKVFCQKDVLKIWSIFTGEHPRSSVVSKSCCTFSLSYQNTFAKNTSGRLLRILGDSQETSMMEFDFNRLADWNFTKIQLYRRIEESLWGYRLSWNNIEFILSHF